MKVKLVIAAVLGVCVWGAIRHFTGPKDAIGELMTVPRSFPAGSRGGMETLTPVSNLAGYCQPGRHTLFVFSWQRCGGSQQLDTHLKRFTRRRPDVAIRVIELEDGWSRDAIKVRLGADVGSVPHVAIYARDGSLLVGDDGADKAGLKTLAKWMNAVAGAGRPGST